MKPRNAALSGTGTAISASSRAPVTLVRLMSRVVVATCSTISTATLTSPTLAGVVPTGAGVDETKFCTTEFVAVTGTTGVTLTDVVGLTGFTLTAAGVYQFDMSLAAVGTANSGVKLGFKYTTATLTSLQSFAIGTTASAVVGTQSTTATDEATLIGNTSAILHVRLSGRIVVNAGGTMAIRAAQNAAHADETKVLVGSWARIRRIS